MKFKRLKIPSDKAISYLKNDNELSQYWEQLNRDCYGEIIIDSDTLDHIGHVFVWHTKKNKGFIFNLEVKPQYRRQGYGWILLDDAVKKYDGIDLLVDEDNIPAIKLYEKYGFETIKTVNGQLWMKLNQIKQEGVIMFFDRLGNCVTDEEPIVKEPVVESYYDPNRPIRPGFEKPQPIQEVIEEFYIDKTCDTYEDCDSIEVSIENIVEYSEMDIDEMSDYIQEHVITEATSRSLKEVKQYQQKRNSMFNDKNKQQLKNFLRNKLSRNGRNSLVCNIRKDIDCKTDDDLAMFNILKNVCDRYHGYTKREKIDGTFKRTKSNTYTAEKMRICELFGLDGKKYGIEEEEIHDDWIYLKFNEFNNIRNIFPVNKRTYYRFIHFTKKKNLAELSPTLGSSHFNSGYANDTVFFFAIKRGAYMPDVLRRGLNYGENAYEYIPKANDKIYLDFTDTKPNMRDSVIPVYIETKRSLPVKKIEFDREGFKESYNDENVDDEFVSREIILEEKISAAERNELDDDDFGLVYTDEDGKKVRKYPLTDENHIRQAVRFFSHCPDEHKPHLARKILKKANEHDMDTSNWETIHEWAKK